MQIQVEAKQTFRVWGVFDGKPFDRNFPSAAAWRVWRSLNERRYGIEVLGMKSEAA